MANPVRPADFHLGSYLGEQAGQNFQSGLQKSFGQAYEGKIIENALKNLDPNAPLQEKWQTFAALPISNESKKIGMKYLEEEVKNRPSLEKASKALSDVANQFPVIKESLSSYGPVEGQTLLKKIMDAGATPEAVYKVLQDAQGNPDYLNPQGAGQPGEGAEPEGSTWRDRASHFKKHGKTTALETAFRKTNIGKITGQHDPEALERLAAEDPKGYNDWIANNLGTLAIDYPLYAAAFSFLGPIGGMAAVQGLAEGADRTWALARKHAKGEEITGQDYQDAANATIKEALKGTLWGTAAKLAPMQKLIQAVPGGQRLLQNSFAQGAAQVAEAGLVAPELAHIATEGKAQEPEDRLRNLLLALGFRGIGAAQEGLNRGQGQPPPTAPEGQASQQPSVAPSEMGPARQQPPDLQGMVASARSGEEALAARRTQQKVRATASQVLNPTQNQEGASIMPGSEARGDVSIPLAPQVSNPPRFSGDENTVSQNAGLQDAALVSGLAGRVQQKHGGGQFPTPQPIQLLQPLQQEQRLGQMRGEQPFIPTEERQPSGHEATETIQKREGKAVELKKTVDGISDQVRQLNALEKKRNASTGKERENLDNEIAQLREKINEGKKLARRLQKDIKTGREKLSDDAITNAIANRRRKLIENASNEKPLSEKEAAKRLVKKSASDKRHREAQQLKRQKNKLPEDYTDSYIRVKEAYIKEFSRIRDQAKKEIDSSEQNSPEYRTAKKIYDEAAELVRDAEADIIHHKHRKGQEYAAEQVKKGEQVKAREKTNKKVGKVGPKSVAAQRKLIEDYHKNKSAASKAKIAEQIGVKPEQVEQIEKEAINEGKKFAKRHFEHIKIKPKSPSNDSKSNASESSSATNKQNANAKGSEGAKAKENPNEGAKKGTGVGEALDQVKEQTQTNQQQQQAKGRWGQFKKDLKNLFSKPKEGKWKHVWGNPLGRAFIIQGLSIGLDEGAKALGLSKTPFYQLGTLAFGGVGRVYRGIISAVYQTAKSSIKSISTSHNQSEYRKALKNHDYKKIKEYGDKLTPKQKKQA